MKRLMTKHFSKWASKQKISVNKLTRALAELKAGSFEANLGGHIYKKEFGLRGKAKVAVEEQLFATKREIDRAIFIYGFAKNEKSNLSKKELYAFKELSKILL
jgi:hypothetical protein